MCRTWDRLGNRFCFTYGAVINTSNFDNPTSEPHKLSDLSWAYFATGNVAIDKNIYQLVKRATKNKKGKKITVEVDKISQLKKIMGLKFNRILFDNMSLKNLRTGVNLSKKFYETEASGGVTLKNVKKIASTGVKRISVGMITHSAPGINFRLEI